MISEFTSRTIGSSPRMRGILHISRATLRGRAVHPRGCGEYASASGFSVQPIGSSPRMRGIRKDRPTPGCQPRFIPADAGNTQRHRIAKIRIAVHPRGCGEYLVNSGLSNGAYGSSPRMRGIQTRLQQEECSHRFIPADAGNTPNAFAIVIPVPVHPRGCGEYAGAAIDAFCRLGSSPRMRGIPRPSGTPARLWRFIPADAGNTSRF